MWVNLRLLHNRIEADMQSRVILAPVTIGGALVTVAVVISHILSQPSDASPGSSGAALAGEFAEPLSPDHALLESSSSLLMTGVISTVPKAKDIPVIPEIPWTVQELGREFRRAGSQMSCSLLEPGIEIIQPLAEPVTGSERALGRQIAYAMNIEMDPAAKSTLPRVSRGAIESYLESHQMTIQAVFYQNAAGELFFGPQVRAGFVAVASPERTIEPEAMIATAIKELRTLGVFWDQTTELVPSQARTLILAFRYSLQTEILGTGKSAGNQEYELIFLHLLKDSTASQPKLAVFATSNARTELNLLEAADPAKSQQNALIAARVRFGDFNMMGMYPANPIVTGVFHKAQLSIPVDSFKALLEGFASGTPRSLTEVLDELHSRGASGDTSGLFDPTEPSLPLPAVDAAAAKDGASAPGEPK